jgi:CheY-like chemotaxis protein
LESGQNLLGIIEVLLDFSALQAGRAKVEPRAFDLLGLITQVTRQAGLMARRKGLTFTYRIQSGVPARIVGDPRRIQQVLHNLLANAANFTNAGGIHLGVSAVRRHGRWRISCSVADSGIGIDSADIPKLFQPFARSEFGQPRQHHGIGLGLNIAESFAELMGGGIAVRSRPGRGSVFRCCFEAEESEASSALRCVSPDGIEGRRVLLACADTDTRRMLSDTIRAWGMEPVVCSGPDTPPSPEQLSKPVDLAIVDASLARNLGAMLHRLLQARPPARSAPVVWLSNPERQWPVPQSSLSLNVAFPLDLTELARAAGGLLRSVHPATQADTPPARLGERLPLRLLVADDIPTNREMLRRLLQHLGYKCQMAVNGAEAVAAVRLQPFDLVILDVEMPVMNGLAAAREIVRLNPDASRRPKLVALTANAQSGDREKCIAAGMDDYLTKPVLPAHIEACFQRMFEVEIQNKQPVAVVSDAADMTFVDRNQLAALFPGMPGGQVAEVLQHLMASACRDLDTAWPKIGQACASRNSQLLAETAHGLKGCFNMLGWSRVASFCNEAIQKARRGEFDGWADFGPELQRLYDHSNSEMLCYIEELARGAKPSAG